MHNNSFTTFSFVFTAIMLAVSATSCNHKPEKAVENDEETVDTIVDYFDWSHYYGDTLFQYDNKTVCISFGNDEIINGVRSVDSSILITLTDSVPTDTCVLANFSTFKVDGDKLRLTVGGDTLRVDFRNLPERIDAVNSLMIKGFHKYSYRNVFVLNDSSENCEYDFEAYLPKPAPEWTKRLIAGMLNTYIRSMYAEQKDNILDEYNGNMNGSRKSEQIHVAKMNPVEIARYYARLNKKLYIKEFNDYASESPYISPKYDFMFNMAPLWINADSSLITYRIETYCYMMGAHGSPEEYFLTCDAKTGKLLSWQDIQTEDDYKNALAVLDQKYKEYKSSLFDEEIIDSFSAALSMEDLYSDVTSIIKENYNGAYYPRPALTNNGLLFSYQPYEAGSFSEGILHFVVPYSAVPAMKVGHQ
ncbi:MAG: RsiV family protein [Muribaculaceae bacterium]|nr:RsiV family protein [Muribaculaceae bacterium]